MNPSATYVESILTNASQVLAITHPLEFGAEVLGIQHTVRQLIALVQMQRDELVKRDAAQEAP